MKLFRYWLYRQSTRLPRTAEMNQEAAKGVRRSRLKNYSSRPPTSQDDKVVTDAEQLATVTKSWSSSAD
jgi:hypothetical protein